MQDILAQFGADMSNIVDETFFVTDMDEAEAVRASLEERTGIRLPEVRLGLGEPEQGD